MATGDRRPPPAAPGATEGSLVEGRTAGAFPPLSTRTDDEDVEQQVGLFRSLFGIAGYVYSTKRGGDPDERDGSAHTRHSERAERADNAAHAANPDDLMTG